VTGKQEGCDNDQQDPLEGLIDAGKRGADGHWVSLLKVKNITGQPRSAKSA
jgi:hypothetical protein